MTEIKERYIYPVVSCPYGKGSKCLSVLESDLPVYCVWSYNEIRIGWFSTKQEAIRKAYDKWERDVLLFTRPSKYFLEILHWLRKESVANR